MEVKFLNRFMSCDGFIMNEELRWIWKKVIVIYLRYYSGISMAELRKIM